MRARPARRHPVALLALAFALATGCGEGSSPTEAALAPSLEGATVERFPTNFFLVLQDADLQLTVVVGGGPGDIETFCSSGELTGTPFDEIFVARPTGAVHVRDLSAEADVTIYNGLPGSVCLEDPGVFATGSVHAVYTESDLFIEGPGADAFGWRVSGIVTGTDERRYRLAITAHGTVVRGEFSGSHTIRLIPIR